MLPILLLLFLVVPIVELAVILKVGQWLGALNTIFALVVVSVAGAWMAKREGLGVLRRMRRQLELGKDPGPEVVDGFLVLLAGALLLTPGFLTDCLALLLLVPPFRAVVRQALRRRFTRGIALR